MHKSKQGPLAQVDIDISMAFKGASKIKYISLVIGFAQGAIKVYNDSKIVQMDHADRAKTCGHQDGVC